MPNIKDPTRTITARRALEREVSRMFNEIKQLIRYLVPLVLTDDIPLLTNQAIPRPDPRNFLYKTDEERIREFERWMTGFINGLFYNTTTERSDFLDKVIQSGFDRGKHAAGLTLQAQLGALGIAISAIELPVVGLDTFVSRTFGQTRVARILYQRAFSQLQGITEGMSRTLSSNLAASILNGDGVAVTVRNLADKVDINKRRLQRIVRTESVHAFNIGSIEESKRIAFDVGIEEPRYVWQTALDGRERPSHNARNGRLYTEKQVKGLIGEPNCRCSVSLHIPEELTRTPE